MCQEEGVLVAVISQLVFEGWQDSRRASAYESGWVQETWTPTEIFVTPDAMKFMLYLPHALVWRKSMPTSDGFVINQSLLCKLTVRGVELMKN